MLLAFIGLTAIALGVLIAVKEFKRIKTAYQNYKQVTLAILLLDLISFSPFIFSILLTLLGLLFIVKGVKMIK